MSAEFFMNMKIKSKKEPPPRRRRPFPVGSKSEFNFNSEL